MNEERLPAWDIPPGCLHRIWKVVRDAKDGTMSAAALLEKLDSVLGEEIADSEIREFIEQHASKIASLYEVGYRDIRIEKDGAGKLLLRTPEDH